MPSVHFLFYTKSSLARKKREKSMMFERRKMSKKLIHYLSLNAFVILVLKLIR